MAIFLALALSDHTALLGLAITAVGVIWYTVVPNPRPDHNRYKR